MLLGSLGSAASPRASFRVGARGPWSEIYDVALPPSKDPYKALSSGFYLQSTVYRQTRSLSVL